MLSDLCYVMFAVAATFSGIPSVSHASDLPPSRPRSTLPTASSNATPPLLDVSNKFVFFAPFDAPFVAGEYGVRVRAILDSLTYKGERTLLDEKAITAYRNRIGNSQVADYRLSAQGSKLLADETKWMLSGNRKLSQGLTHYLAKYNAASLAASSTDDKVFRRELLEFFVRARPYRYAAAQAATTLLSNSPKVGLFHRIRDRVEESTGDYALLPRPDDLDLAVNWRPLTITTAGRLDSISARAISIDVMIQPQDSVLETMIAKSGGETIFLPRTLMFVKDFIIEGVSAGPPIRREINVEIPEAYFNLYSGVGSGIICLLFVELEGKRL